MMSEPDDTIFLGADYLVHTAYMKSGHNVIKSNTDAAERLIKKSVAFGVRKNIFISSMSADRDALSDYGKQKYAIEPLFSGKNDAVIRSGLIIGDGGLAKQVVNFMQAKHFAPLIDNGKQPIQTVAVDDMARVIHAVIKKNATGILNIGTPRVYTYKEYYQIMKSKLRIRALLIPVPYFVPLAAIKLIHILHLPFPITEDNLQGLKRLRAYDTQPDLTRLDITLKELEQSVVPSDYKPRSMS